MSGYYLIMGLIANGDDRRLKYIGHGQRWVDRHDHAALLTRLEVAAAIVHWLDAPSVLEMRVVPQSTTEALELVASEGQWS